MPAPPPRRPLSVLLDLIAPGLLAFFAFTAGLITLVSAATPSLVGRLSWLARVVPLFVVEFSHFAASLIGLALLFLAVGLAYRLRSAWRVTIILLILSAGFAVFRGGFAIEAILFASLAVIALTLGPSFYRQDRLSQIRVSWGFAIAVFLCLAAIAGLGLFTFREVAYSHELWWTFVFYGEASRFLRAAVGVAALAILIVIRQATARAPEPPPPGGPVEIACAARILALPGNGDPQANLALLGDKRFLFSPDRTAFVQFGVRGRTWIAMGEPAGRPAERIRLIQQFQDAADRQGASSAFYAVTRAALTDFIDAGYVALKIGETALLDLAEFTLEGRKRAPLRHARNKAEREGLCFEILPPGRFAELAGELKAISDDWLQRRQGPEKQFSLGRFDPAYLSHFPLALIRRRGRVIAFANLWPSAAKERLTVDLMRYSADAPNGTMDYMFCTLILWAKAEGYRIFDLGMAPLAGLEDRRLLPIASRIGALLFSHGSRLYSFEGLMSYKQKFQPRWEGVYIAVRNHAEASGVMMSVALLTSGGWRGLLV
jgi:phosphatidylglycerol lysyltransferase